jgi:amidohydrolase/N-acyl-D-amino-acid deacylase
MSAVQPRYDTLIRGALVLDGTGGAPLACDVAITGERIAKVAPNGALDPAAAGSVCEARGHALAPGFIDVHAHDDISVVRAPGMTPKISQGVTTVVVGNCGISAAPVTLTGAPPEPMNLLGRAEAFVYPTFAAYVAAVNAARPAVNVAAFAGHTSLRSNHLDRLDRAARPREIDAMREQLREALDHGALGLSTGLAYANASAAPTDEVIALAEPLSETGGIYCTHLRSELAEILVAIEEARAIGRSARAAVAISHVKCAGIDNHGRSGEVLDALADRPEGPPIGWDCYPYTASSTTLQLTAVTDAYDILVTWSDPHPQQSGRLLADIARDWRVDLREAAARLQPAGAVYFCMAAEDVDQFLRDPRTAIGSDGLPNDAHPHPRLWGTFPRVLGHYVRERQLFSLAEAVRKMTGLSADRFGLAHRGYVREGYWADLVLFDPNTIRDVASYAEPARPAAGIAMVWVNGTLTWRDGTATGGRAGRFVSRSDKHSR